MKGVRPEVSKEEAVALSLYRFQGSEKKPEGTGSRPRTLTTAQMEDEKESLEDRLQRRKSDLTGRIVTVSGRVIKRTRAQGGCQGTKRRRRTWQAAKSKGEPQAGIDPLISEWGNPAGRRPVTHE